MFPSVPGMLKGMNTRMTQRTNLEVGERVRARRIELSLTPSDVTTAADVDPKTLQRLEDGSRWPIERSRRRIEPVLKWRPGALDVLKEGGEPEEDSDLDDVEQEVVEAPELGRAARDVGASLLDLIDHLVAGPLISESTARELVAAADDFKRADDLLGSFVSNIEVHLKYSEELKRFSERVEHAFRGTKAGSKMKRVTELEPDLDAGPLS
ncbi:Uncharacterised protein [Mycobacteroides abscessus subsp. abscessus]|nr:Uncharacterised protein [Mycobacteroides abscessus subsp. abscessus]